MQAEIVRRNPGRFDIPSVMEIQVEVAALVLRAKKKGPARAVGGGSRGVTGPEARWPAVIAPLRDHYLSIAGGLTAAPAIAWMTRVGGYAEGGEWPADGPTEQQIRGLISKWRKNPPQPAAAAVAAAQ